MANVPTYFNLYDIRGRVPDELNDREIIRIGNAFLRAICPRSVVLGHDMRPHSPGFAMHLRSLFLEAGVHVFDAGLCGTEEVYFHTADWNADLGVMITASHNPVEFNGIKFVGRGSVPILDPEIRARICAHIVEPHPTNRCPNPQSVPKPGVCTNLDRERYLDRILSLGSPEKIGRFKVLINPGNGCAGAVAVALADRLPIECLAIHATPDPQLPLGAPNPLLADQQAHTSAAVRAHGADMGIAWDGDFDRCFFFDHEGRFVDGCYCVALLSELMLDRHPGGTIVYDPRLTWCTESAVRRHGGKLAKSRTGHAYIKATLREVEGVFGGESSGHYYFRDFFYCDSGMIPWLLMLEKMAKENRSLRDLVARARLAHPNSGEINITVRDRDAVIDAVRGHFRSQEMCSESSLDGWSVEYPDWRMNIRKSNTENIVRLCVEARSGSEGRIKPIVDQVRLLAQAETSPSTTNAIE